MSDAEALMWTIEKDPAFRSSFLQLTLLDSPPDFARFLWSVTLLISFLALAPNAVFSGDLLARHWTDILWATVCMSDSRCCSKRFSAAASRSAVRRAWSASESATALVTAALTRSATRASIFAASGCTAATGATGMGRKNVKSTSAADSMAAEANPSLPEDPHSACHRRERGAAIFILSVIVLRPTGAASSRKITRRLRATKAAMTGIARTWALELAPAGITVNVVAPGPISDTEMFRSVVSKDSEREKALAAAIPVKRLGRSDDVARAVIFFCDRANGFVTGQTLYVCGGASVGTLVI